MHHQHETWNWSQSVIGGGGFITGLLQDPFQPEVFYARCDVAGVFRSVDGGRQWQTLNRNMHQYYHHCVHSFAVSPHTPGVMFRCSGDIRNGQWFGAVHKSRDGGESWYPVACDADFFGNGPTRMNGELIMVDPFDPDRVVTGSLTRGVFFSEDGGETFRYDGLAGERLGLVAFHPAVQGRIYAATVGLKGDKARLFCRFEGTNEWTLLADGLNFSEMVFDPDDTEVLYVAGREEGILRSTNGGWHFTPLNNGLLEGYMYQTLTLDTDGEGNTRMYTAARIDWCEAREIPIPVYVSEDRGQTWTLIRIHQPEHMKAYPAFMNLWTAGACISRIRVHAQDKNRLYLTNWFGCAISEDRGHTWCGNMFRGMETTCIEHIQCHPAREDTVCFTLADHLPHVSHDAGRTYDELMGRHQMPVGFSSSTALVFSVFRPGYYLFGGYDLHQQKGYLFSGTETDEPNSMRLDLKKGLFVQVLTEDPFTPGRFFAYIDGAVADGAGIWRSHDWGVTWEQTPFSVPGTATLPVEKAWVEGELLPVVVSQVKNVCGTNQLMCMDPHRPGVIYAGEGTRGLFISEDGGDSWRQTGHYLPFRRLRASLLNTLVADRRHPGVLYAGFIAEGLWRSMDYGATWQKILPVDHRIFNATSVAIGGPGGMDLCVVCEPLYWSDAPSAVFYSRDGGLTWTDIMDHAMGAIRWKGVALDPYHGVVHAVSCGNGCFRAEPPAKTGV